MLPDQPLDFRRIVDGALAEPLGGDEVAHALQPRPCEPHMRRRIPAGLLDPRARFLRQDVAHRRARQQLGRPPSPIFAFEYIERFYNSKRRHSRIGYMSHVESESQEADAIMVARERVADGVDQPIPDSDAILRPDQIAQPCYLGLKTSK